VSGVSLLDLVNGEAPEHVTIRGQRLAVVGLPAIVIARLFKDVPSLGQAVAVAASGRGGEAIDVAALLMQAPEIVAMAIAAGLGHYGETEWEAAANRLALHEQAEILAIIWRATTNGGIGPFAQRLAVLAKDAGIDLSAVQASSQASPRPSAG
jgi:fermentation-respiration switch protein FrsA (DUF1100 family)